MLLWETFYVYYFAYLFTVMNTIIIFVWACYLFYTRFCIIWSNFILAQGRTRNIEQHCQHTMPFSRTISTPLDALSRGQILNHLPSFGISQMLCNVEQVFNQLKYRLIGHESRTGDRIFYAYKNWSSQKLNSVRTFSIIITLCTYINFTQVIENWAMSIVRTLTVWTSTCTDCWWRSYSIITAAAVTSQGNKLLLILWFIIVLFLFKALATYVF